MELSRFIIAPRESTRDKVEKLKTSEHLDTQREREYERCC